MYLAFHGLHERPFTQTPDPRFLYWNEGYREALASLRYGIQQRKGFVALIGEAGTGQTTLLRKLLDDLADEILSVFLFNPNASFEEILEYTLSELGISAPSGRKLAMTQRLNEFLLSAYAEGRNTVLIIDEAQDLSSEVLESLRLLSNLETAQDKILQIVLSGQPELATRLARPELRQLKQRISVRARLEPLSRAELAPYIAARLAVAGGAPDLFAPDAFDAIWGHCGGIPRLVNTICDNALLVSYALGRHAVDAAVISEVATDLAKLDAPGTAPRQVSAAAAIDDGAGGGEALRAEPPVPAKPVAPPPAVRAEPKPESPVSAPQSARTPEASPPEPTRTTTRVGSSPRGVESGPPSPRLGLAVAGILAAALLLFATALLQRPEAPPPLVPLPSAFDGRGDTLRVPGEGAGPPPRAALAGPPPAPLSPPADGARGPSSKAAATPYAARALDLAVDDAGDPSSKTRTAPDLTARDSRPVPAPDPEQIARTQTSLPPRLAAELKALPHQSPYRATVPSSAGLAAGTPAGQPGEADPVAAVAPLDDGNGQASQDRQNHISALPAGRDSHPPAPAGPQAGSLSAAAFEALPAEPAVDPAFAASALAPSSRAERTRRPEPARVENPATALIRPKAPAPPPGRTLPLAEEQPPLDEVALPESRAGSPAAPSPAPVSRESVGSDPDLPAPERRPGDRTITLTQGDTLLDLVGREYGEMNYTAMEILRARNPQAMRPERMIAGTSFVIPAPGAESRMIGKPESPKVLALATPILARAMAEQAKLAREYGDRVRLETSEVGTALSVYRVVITGIEPHTAEGLSRRLGPVFVEAAPSVPDQQGPPAGE